MNVYVGGDGKLHFVNSGGADSALPFNTIPSLELIINKDGMDSSHVTMSHTVTGYKKYLIIGIGKYIHSISCTINGKSQNPTTQTISDRYQLRTYIYESASEKEAISVTIKMDRTDGDAVGSPNCIIFGIK